MKLSKILLSTAVLAAAMTMALTFTSCGEKDDDDNNMLSGSNNDYSIDYTNESSDVSRGYKTTTFMHLGALCQMKMAKASAGSGAMGYIWDLESNSARAEKDPRRFFIFGFNYDTTTGVKYYLSLYKNVKDIQKNNFGATAINQKEPTAAVSDGATEKEYWPFGKNYIAKPSEDEEGNIVVTVNVYEGTDLSGQYDGTYIVDLYDGAVTKDQLATATKVNSCVIPAADVGYLAAGTNSFSRQKNGAVYANCYAGKTLSASWHYADTYREANVEAN